MTLMSMALAADGLMGSDPADLAMCLDAPPAMPSNSTEALERTVRVETASGTGSAFFVSPDGFALTAAHVVTGQQQVSMVLYDDTTVLADVVRLNGAADLALLDPVEPIQTPCFQLAEQRAEVGEDAFLIGSPGGEALTHTLTKGIVSSYRDMEGVVVVQTDASVSPGASGGVLLNDQGQALGIVSFKLAGGGMDGLGFAIAVEEVRGRLDVVFTEASDETIEVRVDYGAQGGVLGPDQQDTPYSRGWSAGWDAGLSYPKRGAWLAGLAGGAACGPLGCIGASAAMGLITPQGMLEPELAEDSPDWMEGYTDGYSAAVRFHRTWRAAVGGTVGTVVLVGAGVVLGVTF